MTMLMAILYLFIRILRSFRILYSVGVNKLKIQSAEIEIGRNINKSILNNHLLFNVDHLSCAVTETRIASMMGTHNRLGNSQRGIKDHQLVVS